MEELYEKFSWVTPEMKVNDAPGHKVIIRGKALFSVEKYLDKGISRNVRKYVQNEIVRSARTLKGKPIDVNHEISGWEEDLKRGITRPRPSEKGNVIFGEEEDGAIEYQAEINHKEYAEKVRDTDKVRKGRMTETDYVKKWGKKPLAGVSVDADFFKMKCIHCGQEFVDGKEFKNHLEQVEHVRNFDVEPELITFRRLSLVEPPEVPGVKGADFEIVETAQIQQSRLVETLIKRKEEIEKMQQKKAATETPTTIAIGPAAKFDVPSSSGDVNFSFVESAGTDNKDGTVTIALKQPETPSQTTKEADYPWDQCVSDRMADGYDEDSAKKICAAIKNRTISHTMEFGLAKTQAEAIKVIAEKLKTDPLFNYEIEKFIPPKVELKQTHVAKPALAEIKLPEKLTAKEGCDWGQAGYTSFEDCVSSNSGKGDPEAYCASIMRQLKGETAWRNKVIETVNHLWNSLGLAITNQQAIIDAVAAIPITELAPLEESNKTVHEAIDEVYNKFHHILAESNVKDLPAKLEALTPALAKINETQQTLLLKLSEIENARGTEKKDLDTKIATINESLAQNVDKQIKDLDTKIATVHETLSQTVEDHTKKLEEQENKHKLLNEVYGKLQKDYSEYVTATEAKLKEKDAKIQEVETKLKEGQGKNIEEKEDLTKRVENLEDKLKAQFKGQTKGINQSSGETSGKSVDRLMRGE